jgi:lipopolysaccharide/colanic/teichoic acid biosynthesis glycosyltransferase
VVHERNKERAQFWKRTVDLVAGSVALVVFSPVMAIIYPVIRLSMGTPVVYRQARPGLGGRIFVLYKFRTMTEALDGSGLRQSDERRLTRTGRFLRRTSLDELPELWNVLRGEMSLVGPRPLLVEYLPLYTSEQARRHEVRPGITGLAQVSGRNALSWEDRFRLDVWYVDNWSLGLDFRILVRTIFKVLKREGISGAGRETMEPFCGQPRSSDALGCC